MSAALLRLLHTLARVGYLVTVGFLKDQCIIRASALTFTTMLSIVPFLAVAFLVDEREWAFRIPVISMRCCLKSRPEGKR